MPVPKLLFIICFIACLHTLSQSWRHEIISCVRASLILLHFALEGDTEPKETLQSLHHTSGFLLRCVYDFYLFSNLCFFILG